MENSLTIPEVLTPDQVATLLTVSPRTVEDWRAKGNGPTYRSLNGKQVRYLKQDIFAWLRER